MGKRKLQTKTFPPKHDCCDKVHLQMAVWKQIIQGSHPCLFSHVINNEVVDSRWVRWTFGKVRRGHCSDPFPQKSLRYDDLCLIEN